KKQYSRNSQQNLPADANLQLLLFSIANAERCSSTSATCKLIRSGNAARSRLSSVRTANLRPTGGRALNCIYSTGTSPEYDFIELFLPCFFCKCGRVFKHERNFYTHSRWECGQEPRFKCPYCPKKSHRKANLNKHIQNKHILVKDNPLFLPISI
ncbi:uncharacterized protein LOC112126131, partial [Cimex lectularius]|uniref:C2H2-type domain-containing protein n=1 Tax=Cimex lectularius TaxID=79782 RepID=A0A8I6SKP1_CIMLE